MLAAILLVATAPADFSSSWRGLPDRVWVGEEFFQNCLQDWRIEGGRLVCTEGRPNLPARTLQLLTRTLGPASGTFESEVVIGPRSDGPPNPESWVGIQFGQGGEDVDHRITALVHHQPAEDGGLIAVVDGAGRVQLRDFSLALDDYGPWSLSGPLNPQRAPELPETARIDRGFSKGFEPVRLKVSAEPRGAAFRVTVSASRGVDGSLISEATYDGVPAHQVEGGIALFSHLGPAGAEETYWFDRWRVSGSKLLRHDERAFGPVYGAQYTVGRGVLKLTAQFPPLAADEDRSARLELQIGGAWQKAAETVLDADALTARFRVEPYDARRDTPARIVFQGRTAWTGNIRAEPDGRRPFVLAAFTGNKIYTGSLKWNSNGIWQPHSELVRAVRFHKPDLLFFSGDQIYEGDLTPARRNPEQEAFLDYLYKWSRYLWAFGDLHRIAPSVSVPDDHDVYHGNIWGAGGRKAVARPGITAQDSGGYTMPAAFVNAVHRTQTSHLPDPVDPAPVEQGISVYFTRLEYGGVSFAILGDRQFKSSPTVAVPEGKFVNGWPQAEGFDAAKSADVPGAVLLGERQERFLRQWASDWSHGAWMKAALSQTPFADVATLPASAKSGEAIPGFEIYAKGGYPPDDRPASDGDSNGWPQTGRNNAVRALRSGFAVHVSGDQHLGSLVQYGVDDWRDAGFSFCVPSIGNTWPRRWMPQARGENQIPGSARYTGDYLDGFGNRMTVFAASNPFKTGVEPSALYDRAPGYGIVRFDRSRRTVTFECWPRWVDPGARGAAQYAGWPKTVEQADNYAPAGRVWLPEVVVQGLRDPVLQVVRGGEPLYTLRVRGATHRPWAPGPGTYKVRIGDPDRGVWREIDVSPDSSGRERVTVRFGT